jgi:Lipocalin-like domain
MRSNLPEYASKNRVKGTAAEYQGTVEGSLAYYGTYAVSGTDLDMYVEASTFPNLNGTHHKRINVTIIGDELKYPQPTPSGGGFPAPNVWKRAR